MSELWLFYETEGCISEKHNVNPESQQKDSWYPGMCRILAVPDTVELQPSFQGGW